MSKFTIYNPDTKHVHGEMEFKDYIEAGKYVKENFPEGYISAHEPFNFSTSFRKMLKPNGHPDIKTNRWGICGIDIDGTLHHCGGVTIQELVDMRFYGIPTKTVSKIEFIGMANALADEHEKSKI